MKKAVIVGGGFAGLNAAKMLGGKPEIEVTLIDRRNHHLFQPLLYQVAMAGLSPAEIAQPIRSILSRYRNITVLHGEVEGVDFDARQVNTNFGPGTTTICYWPVGPRTPTLATTTGRHTHPASKPSPKPPTFAVAC